MEEDPLKIQIKYVDTVNQVKPYTCTTEELYTRLRSAYNTKGKKGITCYEYFNANDILVKPHIDYEDYIDIDDFSVDYEADVMNMILICLNNLFGTTDDEWAYSRDSRSAHKEEKPMYKVSFHFVLSNKRTKMSTLKQYIHEHMNTTLSQINKGLDMSIYRNGINKFRLPLAKKGFGDNSLMAPVTHKTKETFHAHIVSHTEYCEDLELKINDIIDIGNEKVAKKYKHDNEEIEKEIEIVKGKFSIIASKEENGVLLHDIKEHECGEEHKNNHNYLVHIISTNEIYVKCHSEKCSTFRKLLFKPRSPTRNFDANYLNNIPLIEGEESNYRQVRNYFERFFIFIRDTNSFYRLDYEYDRKYDVYEQKLATVIIDGYKNDLYYKSLEEGEIKQKSFYENYKKDSHKNAYQAIYFSPCGNNQTDMNKKKYNLFKGYNYNFVLTEQEKETIEECKQRDFQWLLEHIKDYICQKDQHMFDYLMQFFANIIQDPTNIPQIMMVFFSNTHGTGKSGFTKFFSNVIGTDLSYFGSLDQITEKHTNAHVGKLINIIEEVNRGITRSKHSTLKDFSQRSSAICNEKNKPQYHIKTYARYFMTTNDTDGVYFDNEDRRYCVYTFEKVYNKRHVDKLQAVLEDKYIIHLFGKFLEEYEVIYKRPNDWIEHRPRTQDYYNMMTKESSSEFVKEFVKLDNIQVDELTEAEYIINYDAPTEEERDYIMIKKNVLYKLYKEYHANNFNGRVKNVGNFNTIMLGNYKNKEDKSNYVTIYKSGNKQFFKINLRGIWQHYFPEEQFINTHVGAN